MNRHKSRFTMIAVGLVFLGGTAFGLSLLTAPVDGSPDGPTCETRVVKAGENVTTNLITVNVFNASNRSGLANRVNINLQRNGFLAGRIGNSTDGITTKRVTIVTTDSKDPQVRLVAGQFKDKVSYAAPREPTGSGVTIVVGDDYSGLRSKAARTVKADRDVSFCLPFVTVN